MMNFNAFIKEIEEKKIELRRDLPMKDYTTFRIGGNADFAVFPKSREQMADVLSAAKSTDVPIYIVGKGSNLLVSDEGYRGAVVFTGGMDRVEIDGNTVYAEAGVSVTSLARFVAEKGLSGLEFAYGIPGTVGGAVYMNAGAYGSEMKNVTVSSDWWSPSCGFGSFVGEEQKFDYRRSAYTNSDKVILGCKISLSEGNSDEIMEYCRELMNRRRDKQPLEYPSAGSAFKRYPGRFTGQMIDEAGLKGFSVGGAAVSTKHAGFIINTGNATAKDVAELVKRIKEIIFEKEGVMIESEIRCLSAEGETEL